MGVRAWGGGRVCAVGWTVAPCGHVACTSTGPSAIIISMWPSTSPVPYARRTRGTVCLYPCYPPHFRVVGVAAVLGAGVGKSAALLSFMLLLPTPDV